MANNLREKNRKIEIVPGPGPDMTASYRLMRLLAGNLINNPDALEWTMRCICLFSKFPPPAIGSEADHKAAPGVEHGMGGFKPQMAGNQGKAFPGKSRLSKPMEKPVPRPF